MTQHVNLGRAPLKSMGLLGCRAPALTQAGEKGLEPCASDPATCGDSRHKKPILRMCAVCCSGHPCISQTALTECCIIPKLGKTCIMHSCASKIKQMPQGTSSAVDTAGGHGGTRKPNPVVSAMTSVLLKCYKTQQSHVVPAGGAVQPSLCSQETQQPRDTLSLLGPGPWEKMPAASSCVPFQRVRVEALTASPAQVVTNKAGYVLHNFCSYLVSNNSFLLFFSSKNGREHFSLSFPFHLESRQLFS